MLQAANDTLDFMFRLNRKYMKIDLTKLKPCDKLKDTEKERIEQIYARRVQNKAIHTDAGVQTETESKPKDESDLMRVVKL